MMMMMMMMTRMMMMMTMMMTMTMTVNIMHHLGQRCMLTIVSALQIQNLSRLGLNS